MATSKKQPPAKKRKPAVIQGRGAKPTPPRAVRAKKAAAPRESAKPAQAGATAAQAVGKVEQPAEKNKGGRPPIHTPELAAQFCEHLMEGCTLREACAKDGMPNVKTILKWLHDDTGGFRSQYARAREVQAELDVDDQVRIADTPQRYAVVSERKDAEGKRVPVLVALDGAEVANRRLQADARRWRASKMAPKKYGSLLDAGGEGGLALVLVNDMTGRKPQAPQPGQEQQQ